MKNILLLILCSSSVVSFSQNVGIGTNAPTARLHVVQTSDANKTAIYGFANQTTNTDYQNTGVTGFGEGNGFSNSYGYGFGMKGVGSTRGYGAVGVYAGLGTGIPDIVLNNNFYALYADAASLHPNRYAAVFLNGNVGIGVPTPEYTLDVADRIRIRTGAGSAGIWLNNTTNAGMTGFIGTFDNSHLGFYGNDGAGWSFVMNTTNGNVGIGTTTPAQELDVNGNIQVADKVVRPVTGSANLLPIAYGNVSYMGTILAGTGNFTIAHTYPGLYEIIIAGESFSFSTHVATATTLISADRTLTITDALGKMNVGIRNTSNQTFANSDFSFIVYKLN